MCIKFFTRLTNAHERMNVILLLSDHRHVSFNDVAGHLQGEIKLQCVGINPQLKVM
jgi:hypothetical protein